MPVSWCRCCDCRQLVEPSPRVPCTAAELRPPAVVHCVGSLVVKVSAPTTPSPTGKVGFVVLITKVPGAVRPWKPPCDHTWGTRRSGRAGRRVGGAADLYPSAPESTPAP